MASSTHMVNVGDYEYPHYMTVQHCETPGCDKYLGVAYPSEFCDDHRPKRKDA